MKTILVLFFIKTIFAQTSYDIDEVKVYKSQHLMNFYSSGELKKQFVVMLGSGGLESKKKEGDKLVPEGRYLLDEKNPNSKYFRSIHISYPNELDKARAKKEGVEPGGSVFIHGLPNTNSHIINWLREKAVHIKDLNKLNILQKKLDWTKGCIAVSNNEMFEIFNTIKTPTPITIYP